MSYTDHRVVVTFTLTPTGRIEQAPNERRIKTAADEFVAKLLDLDMPVQGKYQLSWQHLTDHFSGTAKA